MISRSDIIYLVGLSIMIFAILYRPYSREFLDNKLTENKHKIERELVDFEEKNRNIIIKRRITDSLICKVENFIDTADASILKNTQILKSKSILDSLKIENDKASKKLDEEYRRIFLLATEYDGGVWHMMNINQIFFYGMSTLALLLMIGSRLIFGKKEDAEKYIGYKENPKQGTDDKEPT